MAEPEGNFLVIAPFRLSFGRRAADRRLAGRIDMAPTSWSSKMQVGVWGPWTMTT